jgi:hypothetical protein
MAVKLKLALLLPFLPLVAHADAISTVIASDTPLFYSTTGYDLFALASSTGSYLLKLTAGFYLQTIYLFRGWIAGALIIGAVIYFSGRAFRFFRH